LRLTRWRVWAFLSGKYGTYKIAMKLCVPFQEEAGPHSSFWGKMTSYILSIVQWNVGKLQKNSQ
jgi:hypothetical protein